MRKEVKRLASIFGASGVATFWPKSAVLMKRCIPLILTVALSGAAPAAPLRSPALAPHAMVASQQHYATQAGIEILKRGGNAVDAAIAIAYALAVVDPCCGNIGGGGFMLVRMHDGRERFIDFREKAPLRARPQMYLDKSGNVIPNASTRGYLAAGVPGTVLGMERARALFATMPRAQLLAPAISLAQNGFVLQPGDAAIMKSAPPEFFPSGKVPKTGDVFVQKNLAATLRLISQQGAPAFYIGTIAREIVAASNANAGILSLEDFKTYTVDEREPLHCSYRGYDIASAPPPSSGGTTMCEILNIAAPLPLAQWGWNSAKSVHYMAEAERHAYADRNTYLGDPAFVNDPLRQLLAPQYAAKLRSEIDPDRATPSSEVSPGLGSLTHEHNETTHFSVVDRFGNAVAVTYTINDTFGAHVIAGNTGFLLNDEMDDFTSKPGVPNMFGLVQGVRNDIQPAKRPLSSMTPTIVTKNGRLFMVTGSPGGSRIITITLNTIQNVIDYGMNAQQAVDAPRTHMQWLPDEIQYEPHALDGQAMASLQAMGYKLHEIASWGSAQAIVIDDLHHVLYGGSDRRHPAGLASGY